MNAWLEAVFGFTLRDPRLAVLGLLLPAALLLRQWRGRPAVTFGAAPLLSGLPGTWRTRLRGLPRALQVAALALLVIALARPVARVRLPVESEGIDVLLGLDRSSSMEARDLDPARDRLAVAKEAATRFATARPRDRVGLLTFARYADVICPPTLDHRTLAALLDDVEMVRPEGPEDATGIGNAVARAAQVLSRSEAKSRVIVLLTDGEENVATAQTPEEIHPLQAAASCRELGVRVYTIAAGAAAGMGDGGAASDVRTLAEQTGGAFFAAPDAASLEAVYAAIDELETAPLADPRFQVRERFLPFVLMAVALLLAGRWLEETTWEALS